MVGGHLLQNSQNSESESETSSIPESREGLQSLSLVHHIFSPVRPTTPSDITLESCSPSHSRSDDLSSPECDSLTTSNSKSSENCKSSTSSQAEQPEIRKVSSEVEPQSQSTTTVEPEQIQREHVLPSHLTTPGYKLVIDNIDSTVKPRYMREDAQNQSLHYVQLYAVKDRVDFSAIPDCPPSSEKNLYNILPTSDDYQMLKENMAVLVSRILVEHLRFFSEDFKNVATWHIQHRYSAQMSQKSEVVSLSFFLHVYYMLITMNA